MQGFRDLKVWEKAHRLTLDMYGCSRDFPDDERFGLTSQLRRACVSIGANLAEGCCRNTDKDFARFVDISLGSASEVEYLLLLSTDLGYLPEARSESLDEQICEVKRMLTGLKQRLRCGGPRRTSTPAG